MAQSVLVDHVSEMRRGLVRGNPPAAGKAQLARGNQGADSGPHLVCLVPPPPLEVDGLSPGVFSGGVFLEDGDDLVEDLAHAVLAGLEALVVVLVDGEEPEFFF